MNALRENPFPGMNPYLEEHWTDVHPRLIIHASAQLQQQMPPSLVVRVEQDIRVDEEDSGTSRKRLDVTIHEDNWGVTDAPADEDKATVAVAEPVRITMSRPERRRIVIKDKHGRVITAIKLLSPANKTGYDAVMYAEKRGQLIDAKVNLVEIDLVRRGGLAACLFDNEPFMDSLGWTSLPPYAVTVMAGDDHSGFSFYPIRLQEALPAFHVPLRSMDRPAVLELQPLINQCYREGAYWRTDYTRPADPPLHGEHADWADSLLKEKGLR
ncbi:MAG: DUF4058 family protein [Roseimicrobium sp.]